MTLQEQQVLTSLYKLHKNLSNSESSWDNSVYDSLKIFEASISSNNLYEKYKGIKQVLKMYGGMGSINDQGFTNITEESKNEVYRESLILLKSYWKELGNESYNDGNFNIFPIGTIVKLIPDSIRYFDNEQKPMYTNIDEEDLAITWEIISNQIHDVTNMIEYGIYSKETYTYSKARHSCLEIAAQ